MSKRSASTPITESTPSSPKRPNTMATNNTDDKTDDVKDVKTDVKDNKTDVKDNKADAPVEVKVSPPHIFYYHGPCPDGQSARAVAEVYWGAAAANIDFRPYAHGKLEEWKGVENKDVWFVDVTPIAKDLFGLKLSLAASRRVIDHHSNKKNRAIAAQIDSSTDRTGMKNLTMVLDTGKKTCGAKMLFQTLYGLTTPIPEWLEIINKGDTGQSMNDEEYAWQCFLCRPEALRGTPEAVHKAINTEKEVAIEQGKPLAATFKAEAIPIFESMSKRIAHLVYDGKEYVVGVLKVPGGASIKPTSEHVWNNLSQSKAGPVDVLMYEWNNVVDGKAIPQVSLRRRADLEIDLAEIAGRNGGGGHEEAAAVQVVSADLVL